VNVEGAERIAEAVAKYDVDRFIHVSSYNADPHSPSEFFSTKVRLGTTLGLFSDTF
jgi:NADH dehydrogenase (ubiquinone) 1 alpha subcomplex subunit 9